MVLERLTSTGIAWKPREEEESRLVDGDGEIGNTDVRQIAAVKRDGD
jgi:hypothetical protein